MIPAREYSWEEFLRDNDHLYKDFIASYGLRQEFEDFVKKIYEDTK